LKRKMNLIRLTALVVMLSLLFASLPVSADDERFFAPGKTEYELDTSRIIEAVNAGVSDGKLVFQAGGSLTLDHQLPFESDKITITYDELREDGSVTLTVPEGTYTAVLSSESTTVDIPVEEFYGSKHITIKSAKPLTITGFKYTKLMEITYQDITGYDYNTYEEGISTAIIVKLDRTAIMSRGAMRRIGEHDLSIVPKNVNGSVYLPLKMFATELKLYCEDYADKSYILLRDDKDELALIGGKGYLTDEKGNRDSVEMNVLYEDGLTWVPVRQLAEMFGYYVNWSNGCVVIDDRLQTEKIITTQEIFTKANSQLDEYILNPIQGNIYHVAQSAKASDANSGTAEYPFATLTKACQIAKAGDTVIVHGGTYREVLKPLNDGTASAPITFKAAEGETVTVSALEQVTEFAKYDDNIYCAALPKDLGDGRNQLFYKGEGIEEGRHPNVDTKPGAYVYPDEIPDKFWPHKGNICITEPDGGTIAYSDTDLDQPDDYWKGGVFVTMKGYAWSLVSGDITSSTKGQITVKDHDGSQSYNLGTKVGLANLEKDPNSTLRFYTNVHPEDDWGYITNHINTIDLPGEWYIGDGKIYVYPPEGANLSTDFEVKQRQLTIDLRDRKFVTIQNINTIGGGMTMHGDTEGNILDGGSHRYISHLTKLIDPESGYINPGDKRMKPGAPHAGEVGFFLDGENNTIKNIDLEWAAMAGILIYGKYHLVSNNIIANTSYTGSYPGGIWIENNRTATTPEGGHTIVNNDCYNAGRAVFSYCSLPYSGDVDTSGNTNPTRASEIAYNRFHNGSVTTRDTGTTYEYGTYHGTDRIRTTMHHNYVYNIGYVDSVGSWMLFTLYMDGYTNGRDTYNNISFYDNDVVPAQGILENEPYAHARVWNNMDLGKFEPGVDGLKEGDFPGGRPFHAGVTRDGQERYMLNYNNVVNSINTAYYPVSCTDADGKSVYKFEDVPLEADVCNRITINYRRDLSVDPVYNVKVNISGEDTYANTVPIASQDDEWYVKYDAQGYIFTPHLKGGLYDITLEIEDTATDINSITTAVTNDDFLDSADPNVILGGTVDNMIHGPWAGGVFGTEIQSGLERIKTKRWYQMHNTWSHTTVFKDRTVTEAANAVELCYGSDSPNDGQLLQIYVDSLNSEPIAETYLDANSWSGVYKTVKLNRELQPGTHTFYLKFGGENMQGCSNFYYFKWLHDYTEVSEQ